MKKGFWGFAALGAMLAASLLAVPAGAQSVDDKIKALEQELTSLKSQQIELKKEATAAAAALPSFSYRPGNGVNIEAADKSWGVRFSMETNLRMIFSAGQDQVGRTNGEIMLRRWRPYYLLLHRQLSVRNRGRLGHGRFRHRQCQELDGHRSRFHHAARGGPFSPRELESILADGGHRWRHLDELELVASGFQRSRRAVGIRSVDP